MAFKNLCFFITLWIEISGFSHRIIYMKVNFIGLGYIGLPTAIIAARHGVEIAGTDINPDIVKATNEGHLHIVEPGMEEMLKEVVANGRLKAYTEPQL